MKIASSQTRLRELMDDYGITPTEFSKKTGIQKPTLSNYLHGVREPKQSQVAKIADAFNVNPAWVLGYDVPRELSKSMERTLKEQRILSKFSSLSEKDQIEIEKFIDLKLSMSDLSIIGRED